MCSEKIAKLIDRGCKEAVEVMKARRKNVDEKMLQVEALASIHEALGQCFITCVNYLQIDKRKRATREFVRQALMEPFRIHTYISSRVTHEAFADAILEAHLQIA